jgi:hypothetical protein
MKKLSMPGGYGSTRMRRALRGAVLALAATVLAVTAQWSFAQNANSGEIKGIVTDSSGAVIPGADVSIRNVQTGVVIRTVTNGAGLYDVPSVPPGDYSLTFSKSGFRDAVRNGVVVHVATIGINAALQVGMASQQVVVTAAVPLLQTEDSSQNMDFNARQIQNAPIVGGIWYNELTNEIQGVNNGGSQGEASGQGVGVNGMEGFSGSFLIEGASATEPRDANASDNYPPIDALSEANVQTANFGAQYGNGVVTFNAMLKSGTNKFHGSLFEFDQNSAFNARGYFNRPPAPVAPERWNEFGGSIGGPIIKNKLFFFFTYQDNPNTTSSTYITTVPTQGANNTTNMDKGCFPTTVTNPSTGQPYPNNCVTSAFDPVAVNIQKYFPSPNLPGYVNNYSVTQTNPSTSQWYVGKLDYTPTQSQHISGSYMIYPISLVNSVDAFCSLGFDCTKGNNYNEDGQITDVWTINSQMVNEARIGGVRELDKYIPPTYDKNYPTTLGLQPTYGTDAPGNIFPGVTINSGGNIGGIGINGGVHAKLADGTITASDVFTLIRGRHTINMGGEYDRSYQNYTSWGDVSSGNFVFDGVATGVPYADFLLGEVYGWYVYEYAETGARARNGAAFVQDNFQVNRHLAINAGLRYQFQGGWSEEQNRWGTFNPNVINTGQYAPPNTLGAMSYGGQQGRKDIQSSTNEFQPRIGLSWSPLSNWAFRASYGIFYQPWAVDPYSAALGVGLNPQGSKGYGSSPAFLLKDGPGPGAVVYPKLSNLSNSQFNYQNVSYYPEHRPATYYQEALVSIQHQLPGQLLLDLSYVMTKGTHLGFSRDINQVPQADMTQYTDCYNAPTAYPLFCSLNAVLFDGYSNYNAMQFRAEKRFSHGLSFLFNYAYSKTLDTGTGSGNNAGVDVWQNAFDVAANYGLSTLDARNTINGSLTYELPFGAGRMVALHGIANQVLGGWRATGVFQLHSGTPFTVNTSNSGQDESGSAANVCGCGYQWLPNVVGNPSVPNPSTNEWFNTAAFATPTPGTFGNERRNTLIGPAWRDLDLSVGKTFPLREGMLFEVRADSFDAFNHPNFKNPNASTGTGVVGGGEITGANGARIVQLGGRFTF